MGISLSAISPSVEFASTLIKLSITQRPVPETLLAKYFWSFFATLQILNPKSNGIYLLLLIE